MSVIPCEQNAELQRRGRDNWESAEARLVVTGTITGGRPHRHLLLIAESVFAGLALAAIVYGLWL